MRMRMRMRMTIRCQSEKLNFITEDIANQGIEEFVG